MLDFVARWLVQPALGAAAKVFMGLISMLGHQLLAVEYVMTGVGASATAGVKVFLIMGVMCRFTDPLCVNSQCAGTDGSDTTPAGASTLAAPCKKTSSSSGTTIPP